MVKMKKLNFKPAGFFFSLMACFILVGCSEGNEPPADQSLIGDSRVNESTIVEPSADEPIIECGGEIRAQKWFFEQWLYEISSDSQTVELSPLKSTPNSYPAPEQWTGMFTRVEIYREYPHSNDIDFFDNLVESDAYRYNPLVTYDQYHNEAGQLILTISVPENDSEYYRLYCLYPEVGAYFASVEIVQVPKQSE